MEVEDIMEDTMETDIEIVLYVVSGNSSVFFCYPIKRAYFNKPFLMA